MNLHMLRKGNVDIQSAFFMNAWQGLGDWLKKAVVCITWGAVVGPTLAQPSKNYTPLHVVV
jgi:hypothetical protein